MNLDHFFSNYHDVRNELIDGVDKLTQEQLEWTPDSHRNSIRTLLIHIAEAEFFWIHCIAQDHFEEADDNYGQDRKTLPEILALLEEWHEKTTSFLKSYDLSQFDNVSFYLPWRKRDVTLGWLVWHVVEHQARHRGQIFMMLRMQGLDVPHV